MSKIESISTIIVEQSIEKCYNYTCDPYNTPEWYSNVLEAHSDPFSDIKEGSIVRLKTEIMGKNHDFEYTIHTLIPHSLLVMHAENGPFPMTSEYKFTAINTQETEVTIINKAEPKNVPFFLVGMVKNKVQETMDSDIKTLKSILEKL